MLTARRPRPGYSSLAEAPTRAVEAVCPSPILSRAHPVIAHPEQSGGRSLALPDQSACRSLGLQGAELIRTQHAKCFTSSHCMQPAAHGHACKNVGVIVSHMGTLARTEAPCRSPSNQPTRRRRRHGLRPLGRSLGRCVGVFRSVFRGHGVFRRHLRLFGALARRRLLQRALLFRTALKAPTRPRRLRRR